MPFKFKRGVQAFCSPKTDFDTLKTKDLNIQKSKGR